MDAVLEPNMCNMILSVDLGTESLPEDISYSCLFWVGYICGIEEDITPGMHHLRDFLFRSIFRAGYRSVTSYMLIFHSP